MQVNLGYHGHEFASLEDALEPASNVAYAARFLKRLRDETRSWARATARYHSRDPDRGQAYRDKVFRLWDELLPRPGSSGPRSGSRGRPWRPARRRPRRSRWNGRV